MFHIVALVCAIGGTPCDRDAARNVVSLGEAATSGACLWNAQLRAGSVAALQAIGPGERIVFVCEPAKPED
jgi:hypothetical protein